MTVSSKERKARKPKTLYTSFLSKADVTIRRLLELLEKLVVSQAGVWIAPVLFNALELRRTKP